MRKLSLLAAVALFAFPSVASAQLRPLTATPYVMSGPSAAVPAAPEISAAPAPMVEAPAAGYPPPQAAPIVPEPECKAHKEFDPILGRYEWKC